MPQKINSAKQLNVPIQTTSGKNGYYAIIGNMQYAWGVDNVLNSGTTLTFARAFSSVPVVICTTQDPNEQTAWVYGRTASAITLKQKYTGNALPVNWLAIGPA